MVYKAHITSNNADAAQEQLSLFTLSIPTTEEDVTTVPPSHSFQADAAATDLLSQVPPGSERVFLLRLHLRLLEETLSPFTQREREMFVAWLAEKVFDVQSSSSSS